MSTDLRRAGRILVNAPAIVESIGQPPVKLHANLAAVYRRVDADATTVGTRFPAVVRDLSTNGCFVAGPVLPLMSRVAVRFELAGVGAVAAVGWVLWLRTDDCTVPTATDELPLPKGFGLLFESVPLETRAAIAALVPR